jgi:hypothetical protein
MRTYNLYQYQETEQSSHVLTLTNTQYLGFESSDTSAIVDEYVDKLYEDFCRDWKSKFVHRNESSDSNVLYHVSFKAYDDENEGNVCAVTEFTLADGMGPAHEDSNSKEDAVKERDEDRDGCISIPLSDVVKLWNLHETQDYAPSLVSYKSSGSLSDGVTPREIHAVMHIKDKCTGTDYNCPLYVPGGSDNTIPLVITTSNLFSLAMPTSGSHIISTDGSLSKESPEYLTALAGGLGNEYVTFKKTI